MCSNRANNCPSPSPESTRICGKGTGFCDLARAGGRRENLELKLKASTKSQIDPDPDWALDCWSMPNRVIDEDTLQAQLALPPQERRQFCRHLEEGCVLTFPVTPFAFPQPDIDFLLARKQTAASYHKNISYRPLENVIRGVSRSDTEKERLLRVMGDYSRRVQAFLAQLLPPYAQSWKLDYASFRPQQEKGRDLKFKARNDLLHVDAFPTRPTHGDRILRFFTNINPSEPRRWIVSRPFSEIVRDYCGQSGMPLPEGEESRVRQWLRTLGKGAKRLGLPNAGRSRYDEFMLGFHDYLKENQDFQQNCPQERIDFAPGSSWLVFTDLVPHAALSGQFALEQTFIVSRDSLLLPQLAPVNVLEELAGARLA